MRENIHVKQVILNVYYLFHYCNLDFRAVNPFLFIFIIFNGLVKKQRAGLSLSLLDLRVHISYINVYVKKLFVKRKVYFHLTHAYQATK